MLLAPDAVSMPPAFLARLGLSDEGSDIRDVPAAALASRLAEHRLMPVRFDYDARKDIRYSVFPAEALGALMAADPDLKGAFEDAGNEGSDIDRPRFMAGRDGAFHVYLDDRGALHDHVLASAREAGWMVAFCRRENDLIDLGGGPAVLRDRRPGFLRHEGELREIPGPEGAEAVLAMSGRPGQAFFPAPLPEPGPRPGTRKPSDCGPAKPGDPDPGGDNSGPSGP